MRFNERLRTICLEKGSLLAIGLDPDVDKIPAFLNEFESPVLEFNKSIINATSDLVCAYKLNLAFYEQFGISGWRSLKKTIELIPDDVLVILDGKRADIGNTSEKYARSMFDELNSDAVTVNPYMGSDSIAPFIRDESKGAFVLCLTSNPGARDFQFLPVDGQYLFEKIAQKAIEWNKQDNVGLVVGATQAQNMKQVRRIAPNLPFLIPGVGAQGGDLETAVAAGRDNEGAGMVIPLSRTILYKSSDTDFASRSREAALGIRDKINRLL
ncbi:MAG: orotidine-5'-phosphate decarboxylase [bacterium]